VKTVEKTTVFRINIFSTLAQVNKTYTKYKQLQIAEMKNSRCVYNRERE